MIKTPHGVKWLSVPCRGSQNMLICDVRIDQSHWQKKHWATISNNYSKARFFKMFKEFFEDLYLNNQWQWLSELNQTFIKLISKEILGIDTEFRDSREFSLSDELMKEDRWIELLKQIGASDYIIGPSARNYLDEEKERKIKDNGINLIWMDYSGYPEYRQFFPPFEHKVSIIDLLFHEGPEANRYMKVKAEG